jgi:hypothetical protein
MSKLYQLIKKDIEELKKIRQLEKEDFSKAKSYPQSLKEDILIERVNHLIGDISRKAVDKMGDNEFAKFISSQYKDILSHGRLKKVEYSYDYKLKPILDYDKIFDLVETKFSEKDIEDLTKSFENNKDVIKPLSKPLDPYVRAIILDMDEMKNLTNEEKEKYKEDLNYIKDEIVEKNNNFVEGCIEKVSQKRFIVASKNLEKWANDNGMDGKKVVAYDSNHTHATTVSNTTKIEDELFKPTLNKEMKFSPEFKKKIFDLRDYLENKSVLKDIQAGESGGKEYGFLAYFLQTYKINGLVDKQVQLQDPEEKKANLAQISEEVNKLKNITKEYDEILKYISDNFDINDVALCGNVYSGRQTDFNGDLSKFRSTLPEKWDNENAGPGVILNGYVQFVSMAKMCDVSLEEMFDHPVESFISGAKKKLDSITDAAVPKIGEASLGQRIAKTLAPYSKTFNLTSSFNIFTRGIEFLNNQCEENDQTYENITLSQIACTYCNRFGVNEITLFGDAEQPNYESIRNMFAFGGDIDNLYTVSNKYPFDLNSTGVIAKNYDAQIKTLGNRNPVTECRNILATYKDYLVETKELMESKGKSHDCYIDQAHVLIAAREYFEDFILKNGINPLEIQNPKERDEVLKFLNNPVQAFKDKYKDEKKYFRQPKEDEVVRGITSFKDLEKKVASYNLDRRIDVKTKFEELIKENSKGTENENQSISEIIEARKGGYLERKFDSTSKEYKALVGAVKAMINPKGGNYGAYKMAKFYAERYVAHKIHDDAEEAQLKANERARVNFCRAVIKSCGDLGTYYAIHQRQIKETLENKIREREEMQLNRKLQSSEKRNERLQNEEKIANLDEIKLESANPIKDFQEALKDDVNEEKLNQSFEENYEMEEVKVEDLNKSF